MKENTWNKEDKDLLLQIPNKLDDTVRLYVDGVFVDTLDANQEYQYRINVLKYVYETGDSSILKRFYFVEHKDTNDMQGEEIKIKKMKIEIEFDGSTAKTLINGKPIHICSDMEHNFMFNAFECIRKHIKREKKYGKN